MHRAAIAALVTFLAAAASPLPAHAAATTDDQAIVQAGLLTLNDFPLGWGESSISPSDDSSLSRYGKTCAAIQNRVDASRRLRTAHGVSRAFSRNASSQIHNTVSVYRTTAATKGALGVLTSAAVAPCLEKEGRDKAKKDATISKVTVKRLSVPRAGDDASGYELAVTVSKHGITAHVKTDVQLVRVGRAALTFLFDGVGSTPMQANQQLVKTVVARVEAAEAGRPLPSSPMPTTTPSPGQSV